MSALPRPFLCYALGPDLFLRAFGTHPLFVLSDSARTQSMFRRGLPDLFGTQVIHAESVPSGESLSHRSIQIPTIPGGPQLPVFDPDIQHRVTADFQSRLVNFRRVNLSAACKLRFDPSKFGFPMGELALSIAAAPPDETELQSEIFDLVARRAYL